MSKTISASTAMRASIKFTEMLASSSALTAIAAFSSALLLFTTLAYGQELFLSVARDGLAPGLIAASIGALALSAAILLLVRRGRAFPPRIFLPAAVAVAVIIYTAYGFAVEAPWRSDFERMWIAAGQLVEQGRFAADGIAQQRVLPILWPAVYLFGHNPLVVPIVNSLILILVLLTGYDVLRRTHSHLSAQIFTVIWVGGAETAFALKIPTHDLWGIFFIALTLWAIVVSEKQRYTSAARQILLGIIIGIPIVLLEVQRELGAVALVALATAALILVFKRNTDVQRDPQLRARFACLLVGAIIAFAAGTAGFKKLGVITTAPSYAYLSNLRKAAVSPSYSDGTFRYAHAFGDAFLEPQGANAQRETANSLLLSDFSEQPLARIPGIAFKTSRLALLGSQHNFYYHGLGRRSPDLAEALTSYRALYAILVAGLFLFALPSSLRTPPSSSVAFSLAFIGVLIGGLVTVGEVQPRYAFPIWLFAPLIIAAHLGRICSQNKTYPSPPLLPTLVVGSITIIAVVAAAWLIIDNFYTHRDGRVITSFSIRGENAQPLQSTPPLQLDLAVRNKRSIGIGDLGFTLGASDITKKNSRIIATRKVCAGDKKRNLRFGYIMPYDNPNAEGSFELEVWINDRLAWSRVLPDGGKFRDVEIPEALSPRECAEIHFTLVSHRPLARKSWVEATRTEIYFPRLAEN